MFVQITISEDNAKKLYETDESKRQEALYTLYKNVKPEALLYERPAGEPAPGTFSVIINVDDINALYRRPDYEKAMKKTLSTIYQKQAREKFGPTEEEKKKEAEKKEKAESTGVKTIEAKRGKKERAKGEIPVLYVIPDDDDVSALSFDTVTDTFFEREHCCCDKGFHEELREEWDWTDEAIDEIEKKLEKLGFDETAESTWVIEGKAADALIDKVGKDLERILAFLNSKGVFPFIFRYMTRAKFEEEYGEEKDDDEDGAGWEDEEEYGVGDDDDDEPTSDVDAAKGIVLSTLEALPENPEAKKALKEIMKAMDKKLKEWKD